VQVNGAARRDPETPIDIERDAIRVDGEAIAEQSRCYLLMNKPRGVVTTAADEKGRMTVYDLLENHEPWLGPVGRLDKASEGLLLLTNDSEWAARILDPKTHMDKIYHVQVATNASATLLEAMVKGVHVTGGDILRVKRARLLRTGKKNCWVEVVLDEGKNRQVRRIFQALEVEVLRLVRIGIGPLRLGQLAKGTYRQLSPAEKECIDRAMAGKERLQTHRSLRPA